MAPAELEAVLLGHPQIDDVAVVGIPDELAGECPMAFVVRKTSSNVTENHVMEFVAGSILPK